VLVVSTTPIPGLAGCSWPALPAGLSISRVLVRQAPRSARTIGAALAGPCQTDSRRSKAQLFSARYYPARAVVRAEEGSRNIKSEEPDNVDTRLVCRMIGTPAEASLTGRSVGGHPGEVNSGPADRPRSSEERGPNALCVASTPIPNAAAEHHRQRASCPRSTLVQ
jgi:hypothetical protein